MVEKIKITEGAFDQVVKGRCGGFEKEKRTEKHTKTKLVLYYLDNPLPHQNKKPNEMTLAELREVALSVKHIATYNSTTGEGWFIE